MLNKISLDKFKNTYVCGDIHGNFRTLFYNIRRYNIKDSAIIIAGDVGLGLHKLPYYNDLFKKLYNKYKELNNKVFAVRGNHDDPSYYSSVIDWDILCTVPDYSMLSFNYQNFLCIGGAESIDKYHRVQYDLENNDTTWWKGELPVYNQDKLDEIKSIYNDINIISHCAPSTAPPIDELGRDRLILDNISFELSGLVNEWYYGHYHRSNEVLLNDIMYFGLDIMEIREV